MRTTLALDDDLAQEIREVSRKSGESFKAVVNAALRRGLMATEKPAQRLPRFEVKSKAYDFQPGVDAYRLKQLNDDLETEEFLRKGGKT